MSLTRSELEIKINNRSATHRASRRCGEHSDPADLPQEPELQPLRPNPDAPALQTREHRVTLHTRSCPEHTHTHFSYWASPTRSRRSNPTDTRAQGHASHSVLPRSHTHFSYLAAPTRSIHSSPTDTRAQGHASHLILPRTHTLQLSSCSDPIQMLQPYRHESTGSRVTLGPAQNTHTHFSYWAAPTGSRRSSPTDTRAQGHASHSVLPRSHTHFSYLAAPTRSIHSSPTDTRAQGHASHLILPRTHTHTSVTEPLRPDPDAPALEKREHRVTRHTRSCPEHTHTSVTEPLRPDPDAPALEKRDHSVTLYTRSCPEHTHFSYWAAPTRSRRSSPTDTRAQGHSSHSILPRTHTFQLLSRSDPIQTLQHYRHESAGSLFTLGPAQNTHISVIEPLWPDPDAPALQTQEHRVSLHTRSCPEHTHTSVIEPLRPDPDAPALQTREHRVTLHTTSCPEHTHTLQLLSLSDPIQTLQPYRHESTGSRFTLGPAQSTHNSVIEPLRPSTACGSERRHMVWASKHTGVYTEEQKIFS